MIHILYTNMPNWCCCEISITGNMEKISKMLSKDEDGETEFLRNLVPYEGEWDYDWCLNNWSTKWDVGGNGLEVYDNKLCGWADFAWSPPLDCFKTYCKQNPDVFIKMCYIEPGMLYLGYWDSNENTIYDDYYNSSNHEKYCENYKNKCDIDVKEDFNFDYFEYWLADQDFYFCDESDEEDSSDEEEDSSEEELTYQFINEIACY